jgi:hypothetical protein
MFTRRVVIWNGTPGDHSAMLDQRFLDGVLFARWMRARLLVEEASLGTILRHQRGSKLPQRTLLVSTLFGLI